MPKTYKLEVEWSMRWTTVHEITIADNATARDIEAEKDRQVFPPGSAPMHRAEWESDCWIGEDPVPFVPAEMPEPEPVHWCEARGHRWLSDGACVVREDGPRQKPCGDYWYQTWIEAVVIREKLPEFLAAAEASVGPPHGHYHVRFRPLVDAADRLTTGTIAGGLALVCWRDGEVIALAMALRERDDGGQSFDAAALPPMMQAG